MPSGRTPQQMRINSTIGYYNEKQNHECFLRTVACPKKCMSSQNFQPRAYRAVDFFLSPILPLPSCPHRIQPVQQFFRPRSTLLKEKATVIYRCIHALEEVSEFLLEEKKSGEFVGRIETYVMQ